MKKLLIGILLLSSCTADIADNEISSGRDYTIVTIDGCEYIKIENSNQMSNSYAISLTHKGDCKNKIHYEN